MKKLRKTLCGNCEAGLDISELEPFTQFTCPGCGTELFAPAVLGHIRLDIPRGQIACFKVFDGFDAKKNLYVNLLCHHVKDNLCDICGEQEISENIGSAFNEIQKIIHPNICPVIGLWHIEDYIIVASPRMDGFDFSEYDPQRHGLLNLEKTLIILQKAAVGLAAAHQKGIVHHNVCPENLHIDLRGNVRWKNFFISNFVYYHCQNKTFKNVFFSSNFMSPEKLQAKQEDKKSDVFSFAALSYFLLTGKYPFHSSNRQNPLDKPFSQNYYPPQAPCEIRSEISEQISNTILMMLSPDPNQRAGLAELISEINIFLAEIERDRIYESQWRMVVSSTDTKQIPKMDKVGFKAEDFYQKKDQNKNIFSLKNLLEPNRRK